LASCELSNEDANERGTVIDAESEVNLLSNFIGVPVPSTLYSFLLDITFAMYDTCVRALGGDAPKVLSMRYCNYASGGG